MFIGVLAVAPRTDLKWHLDEKGVFEDANLDTALRQSLTEIFSLPPFRTFLRPWPLTLMASVPISSKEPPQVFEVSIGR